MSWLWGDGFGLYGGTLAKMLDGEWAEANAALFQLSAANPRSGTHALRLLDSSNTGQRARRVWGGNKTTVGVGFAMYMAELPATSNKLKPIQWLDNAANEQCHLGVNTTGDLTVYYNGGSAQTSAPALTAAAYSHVEAKATIDPAAGAIEVRVNQVTVINRTAINTQSTGLAGTDQLAIGQPSIQFAPTTDFDDMFAWDTATGVDPVGGDIVDFVGDKKVLEDVPNADGVEQDMAPSTGAVAYGVLDDLPPNDATDYVGSNLVGDQCAVRFPAFPANVVSIAGMMFVHRSLKTDAGDGTLRLSARSGTDVAAGDDQPVTAAWTNYWTITQADPATGMPYDPTDAGLVEALLERIA